MKIKDIFLSVIMLALLAAVIFVGYQYTMRIKQSTTPVTTTTTTSAPQKISTQTITYTENNTAINSTANLKYPEFFGMSNTAAQTAINTDIKNSVFTALADFKQNTHCAVDPNNPLTQSPCEFDSFVSNFTDVQGKILSVSLGYYQFTQGANGATIIVVLNYNEATGAPITVASVFKKDAKYLPIISAYAKTYLTKTLLNQAATYSDPSQIAEGVAVNSDNYNDNIGFNNDGVVVIFQQYQVAAGVAGPQTVVVPYANFEGLIDPRGLLSGQ